jgi:hypothetical protein
MRDHSLFPSCSRKRASTFDPAGSMFDRMGPRIREMTDARLLLGSVMLAEAGIYL